MAVECGISFTMSRVPDVALHVDADLVVHALENILDNAFRHTHAGERIDVDVSIDHANLRVGIGNNGPAIAEGSRPGLFDRFAQTGGNAGRTSLGLGLHFCRLVVEAHGGSIGMEATVALPTVFALQLPL
jgi:K+-sensing histidine kinase KdpD